MRASTEPGRSINQVPCNGSKEPRQNPPCSLSARESQSEGTEQMHRHAHSRASRRQQFRTCSANRYRNCCCCCCVEKNDPQIQTFDRSAAPFETRLHNFHLPRPTASWKPLLHWQRVTRETNLYRQVQHLFCLRLVFRRNKRHRRVWSQHSFRPATLEGCVVIRRETIYLPLARAFRERGKVSGSLSCAEVLLAVHPCRTRSKTNTSYVTARLKKKKGNRRGKGVREKRGVQNNWRITTTLSRSQCCNTTTITTRGTEVKSYISAFSRERICVSSGGLKSRLVLCMYLRRCHQKRVFCSSKPLQTHLVSYAESCGQRACEFKTIKMLMYSCGALKEQRRLYIITT